MSSQVYLVTGANRGLGRGLVETLVQRPDTTVIAVVRDLGHPTAKSLADLPTGQNSVVISVKIDSASETDAAAAAQELQTKHGVLYIDTIIANAGVAKFYGSALQTPIAEMQDHFVANTLGPLVLFQAMWPMLQKSKAPKFVAISTGLASIGDMAKLPMPAAAYGSSKVALNYLVRKLHFEHEKDNLIAFPLSPGWVQTDMGNLGARSSGMEAAPVTVRDSVDGMLQRIDNATKETSGTFQSFDTETWSW